MLNGTVIALVFGDKKCFSSLVKLEYGRCWGTSKTAVAAERLLSRRRDRMAARFRIVLGGGYTDLSSRSFFTPYLPFQLFRPNRRIIHLTDCHRGLRTPLYPNPRPLFGPLRGLKLDKVESYNNFPFCDLSCWSKNFRLWIEIGGN